MPNSSTTIENVTPGQSSNVAPKAMASTPRIAIIHQFRTSARDVGENLDAYVMLIGSLMGRLRSPASAPPVPDRIAGESMNYGRPSTEPWGACAAGGAARQRSVADLVLVDQAVERLAVDAGGLGGGRDVAVVAIEQLAKVRSL